MLANDLRQIFPGHRDAETLKQRLQGQKGALGVDQGGQVRSRAPELFEKLRQSGVLAGQSFVAHQFQPRYRLVGRLGCSTRDLQIHLAPGIMEITLTAGH